jgi:hypothetical protein
MTAINAGGRPAALDDAPSSEGSSPVTSWFKITPTA